MGDAGFELGALCSQVWSISVQDVDVLGRDVDMREEVLVHEAVVGLRMFTGQADIFVLG